MFDYIAEVYNSFWYKTTFIQVQAENAKAAAKKAFEVACCCEDSWKIHIVSVYKKTSYKPSKKLA